MTEQNMQIKPYPLGAYCEGDGIRFAFVSTKQSCGILIYDKTSGKRLEKIPFDRKQKIGNVYVKYLTKYDPGEISYQFYEEDTIVPDGNAAVFTGRNGYGKERTVKDLKAGFLTEDFDWQDIPNPRIPYEDCICYLLHVRGFTKHSSSGVVHRGTFRGILEKLSYLQEIGITTVELQPAYEFLEIPSREERKKELPYLANEEDLDVLSAKKLNYWGYKRGFYYAPKAAYAAGEDASAEFKELVREFHRQGMEIVMQFYFPREVAFSQIPAILRYWVLEYHVDGFHLMGENLPVELFAEDPLLADTKLWYYSFDTAVVYEKEEYPAYCNLACYQDDYLYTMRKFLKGDEGMVNAVLYQMRHIPDKMGRIHYMSNYYGMSLMDMVSYDRKHNEDNGENNRDGNDYNCSWNCGEEGKSRRKKVAALRLQQIKNALCMMMFSQSTPLIFMGDEFGNSQKGNNNPYCQDNTVTWLDWRNIERNAEIYSFFKQLVTIRKAHPILHQPKEPKIMDYIACGYPDLSYHGLNAWRPQTESYSRTVGFMYCGKYARVNRTEEDCFFYVAMNLHWEAHGFGLPRLPRGLKWKLLLSTDEAAAQTREEDSEREPSMIEKSADGSAGDKSTEISCVVSARSILIFVSIPDEAAAAVPGRGKGRKAKKAGRMPGGRKISPYEDRTIF